MKLEQPFIRLPYTFDADQLAQELHSLTDREWLPHASGMSGNAALPLVSRGAGANDAFDGPMQMTQHLTDSLYIRQCMHHIGEVYGRSRLMALDPGAEVSRHVDFNYHWLSRVRIHIPIVTNPDVTFFCGEEHIHMEAGTCWIFDSWRHHRVVNNGSDRRTHLVLDTSGSSRFWQTVRSRLNDDTSIPTAPLKFEPDVVRNVKTERYNSLPVMSAGEMQALVDDLLNDLHSNPGNHRDDLVRLDQTLNDLVHDWRAAWSQYGYAREGLPHYQTLLKETAGRLPQQPRTLTTGSNNIGATPIVMQRIIRAALRPDLLDDVLDRD